MKAFASTVFALCLLGIGCARAQPPIDAERVVIEPQPGVERPPFRFSDEDERFLDEVQHSAFLFFWNAVSPDTGMVYDRTGDTLVSSAGVGFQLSALTIGVERGWVTRDEAEARALQILTTLRDAPAAGKHGLFFHFLDPKTGNNHTGDYEHVVSTIDSALFFAGVLTVSTYFGGEVAEVGDALFAEANWRYFAEDKRRTGPYAPFISLGWRAFDKHDPTGNGELMPYVWCDSGDEHRLVTFLAVCAPNPAHRVEPALYYRLRRLLGEYADSGPMVWFPYSGALFTSFFAHCWIDYASIGPDDPGAFGVPRRPSVDWWENSRRHVNMHRAKAIENPLELATPGPNAWGLTASDGSDHRYLVPGLFPNLIETEGALKDVDIPDGTHRARDEWFDGTIAPYGAGSSIMFEPEAAIAALRHYRSLEGEDGEPLVWRGIEGGEYGFRDSYRLGAGGEPDWVATDFVAIDQGPMLLAIENARTGLIWRLFHEHPSVRSGLARLELNIREKSPQTGG